MVRCPSLRDPDHPGDLLNIIQQSGTEPGRVLVGFLS